MNHKPQTLPGLPSLAALAVFCLCIGALTLTISAAFAAEPRPVAGLAADANQTATDSPDPATQADDPAASADAQSLPAANEILTQLRARLEGLDSLKCELQQATTISGMKLTAVGKYVEATGNRVSLQYVIYPMSPEKVDDAKQLALDAAPQVFDEAQNRGVLIQVSDGTILSTSWKNGDSHRVTHRNVRDILAAAEATKTYDPTNAAMDLGVGGLRGLISRLQTSMDFAPVKSLTVGERQVFEVTGRWNDRIRKDVFKVPEGTLVDPRPQVPEYVRVYVDAETMLPRRIQFLKRSMNPAEKMVRPLITLDLRNVLLNEAVDDQTFKFTAPENSPEEDQTEQVIQLIQQSINPTASPDPASDAAKSPVPR